jgi:hypothetical protein
MLYLCRSPPTWETSGPTERPDAEAADIHELAAAEQRQSDARDAELRHSRAHEFLERADMLGVELVHRLAGERLAQVAK